MTQHNKDILKLIKYIREKMTQHSPKTTEGRALYASLIQIYSLLDVQNEPELLKETE